LHFQTSPSGTQEAWGERFSWCPNKQPVIARSREPEPFGTVHGDMAISLKPVIARSASDAAI
jgi:hypothetical protein